MKAPNFESLVQDFQRGIDPAAASECEFWLIVDKSELRGWPPLAGKLPVAHEVPDPQSVFVGKGSKLSLGVGYHGKHDQPLCVEDPHVGRLTFCVEFDPVRAKQPLGQFVEAITVIWRVCLGSIHWLRLIRNVAASKPAPTTLEKAEVVA